MEVQHATSSLPRPCWAQVRESAIWEPFLLRLFFYSFPHFCEHFLFRGTLAADSPPPPKLAVKDEGLKKLLMSWYYAGYYTGLYEGQQKRPEQGQ